MTGNNFNGKVGEEYDLLLMAMPHYGRVQESVGLALKNHFSKIKKERFEVTELGCGTGITTPYILESDPRVVLTCVDKEPIMIDQAKKRKWVRKYGERLRFVVDDSESYFRDLPLDSLDAVASAYMLHNLYDIERPGILKQINNALAPKGIFVNADKVAQDGDEHNYHLKWQLDMLKIYDTIGRQDYRKAWEEHYLFDNQPGIIWREAKLISDFNGAGFKGIKRTFREHMEATFSAIK